MRWCDLSCPQASFPQDEAVDGAGSCRTFVALYCKKLDRLVPKNAPCVLESDPGKKTSQG